MSRLHGASAWAAALILPLALAPASTASAEPEPAAASAPYEVVRLGDGQMSCQDLLTQINGLTAEGEAAQASAVAQANAKQQTDARRAQNGATAKRMGFGALSTGLAFVPFGGGLASFAVRGAAMNAANAAAYGGADVVQVNNPGVQHAEPPQLKRATHLKDIFARKSC